MKVTARHVMLIGLFVAFGILLLSLPACQRAQGPGALPEPPPPPPVPPGPEAAPLPQPSRAEGESKTGPPEEEGEVPPPKEEDGTPPRPELAITSPEDGEEVRYRHLVEGSVADPSMSVFVAVLPQEDGSCWIQPKVVVDKDGEWNCYAYFGRSRSQDSGKPFDVIAVATGDSKRFREGELSGGLPSDVLESERVSVTRQ